MFSTGTSQKFNFENEMSFADGELGFAFSRDGNKLAWRLLEEEKN